MRDAVVDRKLEHFRVDHDQPALLRPQPVEQAQDHGVDGDRLAGAGGAGDQQVRHAREIDDHGLAADGLAQAERQFRAAVDIVAGGELLAQINLLAGRVGQLDADHVASRDHGDARRERAHGAGDIVGEADHARGLDARRRLELVKRDDRARPGIDDLAAHAEVGKDAFERGRVRLQRVGAEHGAPDRFRRSQQFERGQHIAAARRSSWRARRRFRLARGLRARLVLLVRLRHDRRLQRGTGARIELRFDPGLLRRLRTRRCARRRAARQRPREPRFEAEKAVGDPAQRNPSARFILFERALRIVAFSAPSKAGGETAEDVGGEVHAEVDARESDAEDRQPGEGVHQPLHGDGAILHEVMGDDGVRRRRQQGVPAGEAVRLGQLDAPRQLLRALPLEDVLEDGVDGHGAAGGDHHRPGVVAPPLPQHGQRRHRRRAADRRVRAELGDGVQRAGHGGMIDGVHRLHDDLVVLLRLPLHDVLRLLLEEPEGDRGQHHPAGGADGAGEEAVPPLRPL